MLDSRIDWGATSRLQNVVEDAGREVIQDHCVAEISTDPAADSAEGKCNRKASGRLTACSTRL
jgi:hypothetical protein